MKTMFCENNMKINFSIKSPLLRIAFFALFFIMNSLFTCASAESAKSIDYYSDPQAIIEKISRVGVDKVVKELSEDFNIWLWVMNKISSGEDKWLHVAVALFPGTDAGTAETLFSALGEAFVKAPNKVLTLFPDEFSIKHICSFLDVTDPRFDTKSKYLEELEKRKKSLLSLSDKKLQSVQEQCLKCLEESRKEVLEWFDAQK